MFEMYSSSFPSMIIRISSLVCVQFRQKIFPNKIPLDPIWHLATTITCQNDCHGECDRKITISSATKTIKIYDVWSDTINDRKLRRCMLQYNVILEPLTKNKQHYIQLTPLNIRPTKGPSLIVQRIFSIFFS